MRFTRNIKVIYRFNLRACCCKSYFLPFRQRLPPPQKDPLRFPHHHLKYIDTSTSDFVEIFCLLILGEFVVGWLDVHESTPVSAS